MSSAAQLMTGPTRALEWLDRHSKEIEKVVLSTVVVAMVVYGAYSVTGVDGLVSVGSLTAMLVAAVVGRKKAPQLTGTVASTLGFTAVLMLVATSVNPLWIFLGADDFTILYPIIFVAVALTAWIMPSSGVHRGWSTFVGQLAVALTVPVAIAAGGTQWRGIVIAVGAALGLLFVGLRVRHVPREKRGGRRTKFARGGVMALVVMMLGLVMSMGTAPSAKAWPLDWVKDQASDMVSNQICDVTRPDLTGESVGTGPESLMPNFNFAKAKRLNPSDKDVLGYPQYASDAAVFEPGQDNSLSPRYTLYEISGLRGIKWVNWQKNAEGDENCSLYPWISAMVGNMTLKVASYFLQSTISFKEFSQVTNPLEFAYTKANPIVNDLFLNFFAPGAAVMFIVVCISMGWKALGRGTMRDALSDVGGALVVCFIGGFAYSGVAVASWANPNSNGFYTVGSMLDEFGAALNSSIAEVVFASIDADGDSMCVRPESDGDELAPNAPGQRITSCLLAETLAYKPWAVGQFGAAGLEKIEADGATAGSDPRPDENGKIKSEEGKLPCYNDYDGCSDMRSYLIAQMGGPDIGMRRDACLKEGGESSGDMEWQERCDPYHAVAGQLYDRMDSDAGGAEAQQAGAMMASYQASGFMPHLSQAVTALVGVLTVGVGLSVMALITLGWHAWLFILFLFGLVRLLWAVYPGKTHLATSWIQDVVATFTQRILYGFAMTMMIWLISIVFSMDINSGLKILWSVATLVGSWLMIRKIQTLASKDSPNMARYGTAAAAVPAAAGAYAGAKGAGAAGKAATRAGMRATGSAARFAGRTGRVATVGTLRAGGKAATYPVKRAGQYTRDKASEKATAGYLGGGAVSNVAWKTGEGVSGAATGAKNFAAKTATRAKYVGDHVKDSYNMSAREQLVGSKRKQMREENRAQFDSNMSTLRDNQSYERDAREATRAVARDIRSQNIDAQKQSPVDKKAQRDEAMRRLDEEKRRIQQERAERAAKRGRGKFGPGNPVPPNSGKPSGDGKGPKE